MGNVKASRWIDCHEYFSKEYGPEGIARIMAALEPEDRTLFEGDILPIKWIDYGAYLRYMFTADKVLGKGDNGLVTAASQYTARKHFTGIYKIFISLTSPNFIIKRSTSVWRQYFDVGKMTSPENSEKKSSLKLVDYPDIPLHHELSHTPFMAEIIKISGAINPRGVHPKCQARGDDHCLWEFHWD